MGRKKELVDEASIKAAVHTFWKSGYSNTTLKELLDGMQIQNGSFYNSFGSKKNLFLAALKSYEFDFSDQRQKLFRTEHSFKKKIRILFKHIFDRQEASICPKGCFLFNSVASDALSDLDIFKLVRLGVQNYEDFLEAEISLAIKSGELDEHLDSKMIASLIVIHTQGMMNLCVFDFDNVRYRKQTEAFLKNLGL
jgi:TetR/AcrR family transcriptional repressor of nem operon